MSAVIRFLRVETFTGLHMVAVMVLFFGTTVLFGTLAAVATIDGSLPGRWVLIAAGLVYVVGMFLCTARFNVPLNRQLADASGEEASTMWPLT